MSTWSGGVASCFDAMKDCFDLWPRNDGMSNDEKKPAEAGF
jgi:hypothetical protein